MTLSYSVRRAEMLSNVTLQPLVDPPYFKTAEWEKFDYPAGRRWMAENWHLSVYLSAIYVVLVLVGRRYMRDREPFQLKGPLILWNAGLAVFSAMGFYRNFVHMVHVLLNEPSGFHHSVCSREGMPLAILFWEYAGTFSKAAELGDTLFIVLRKSPLIFLHPYHHVTVMVISFFEFASNDPYHRWPMTMNFGVHTVMYTYYGLRAAGFKIPRNLAMSITVMQILQMANGLFLNFYTMYALSQEWDCARPTINIVLQTGMYLSYFILFANFFLNSFFKKGKFSKKEVKND